MADKELYKVVNKPNCLAFHVFKADKLQNALVFNPFKKSRAATEDTKTRALDLNLIGAPWSTQRCFTSGGYVIPCDAICDPWMQTH